ncbi:hypothetical protein [Aureispira anguillae]|uniref:Uncharacterized protein n=1 Tax=Aureispira anguillae TaxID=2864201 RepID=A0A915YKW3_9BACT|nr:hypothetical protein [Aureispira anguillae]BDS14827.1 hypothetical protein AsAng_0056090 [Aureispira anguillae]
MNTTLVENNKATFEATTTQAPQGIVQRYLDFCDRQMQHRMTWFLFPALILPCLFMSSAIYFMLSYGAAGFSIFLFVSMLLFIGGMVATVGNLTTRTTITLFIVAVIWNIGFPALSIFFLS